MSVYLAQSTNWGHFLDRIGIWKCWFLWRGENRSTRRKTSLGKDENQQQTQPTNDAESGNRTRDTMAHIGGRRVLSPLCHPCFVHQVNRRGSRVIHFENV